MNPMIAQLAATDRNPAQETQYQQLLQQAGIPFTIQGGKTNVQGFGFGGNGTGPQAESFFGSGGSGGNTASNAMDIMKQAQQFQVQQNQPAIQTLQTQAQSLPDQYAALLNEIKGAGTAATNYGIMGAGQNLAARGITPDSALYNTTVSQAIAPIGQQYGGLEASLGQGSVQTLNDLAGSIAALQAGNVPGAENFSANISALQNALQIAKLPRETGGMVYNPATNTFTTAPVNTPNTSVNTQNTPVNTSNTTVNTPNTTVNSTPTSTTQSGGGAAAANAFIASLPQNNQNGINPNLLGGINLGNVKGLPTSMNQSNTFGGLSLK